MNRKKMNVLICFCLLICFCISAVLNYRSSLQNEAEDFRTSSNYMANTLNDNLPDSETDFSKETDKFLIKSGQCSYPEFLAAELQRLIEHDISNSTFYYNSDTIPYIFGFINTKEEIAAQSGILCLEETRGSHSYTGYTNYTGYIDLESHLTETDKEHIREIRKEHPLPNSIGVKTDSEGRNIPTELIFGDYITNYYTESFHLKAEKSEKYFTDKYPTLLHFLYYDINSRPYERYIFTELEEALINFADTNHTFHSSGAFSDSDEHYLYTPVALDGEDYVFYFYAKINLPVRALTSDFFIFLTEQLIIMYSLLTTVILYLANRLYGKTEKLNKSRHSFISAAAHELKTPLAVIQNQCECILEGAVDDKKDEYIKSVYDEALRMNDIVTSLLTFNRLSSADRIEKESCNLSALVKEEVEKYLPFARSSGAEISVSADDDITVTCNPKLMALAVDNYLSNAVKYTTGEKIITVTLSSEKDSFSLEVFNTCEPLSRETAENIWDPFERQDASRNRNGSSTGMGLPICKRIFDCHGYNYSCKNTDTGIIFTVEGKK